MTEPLLSVRGLQTHFTTDDGVVRAVDGLDFDVLPGEVFAVVGESGSGKSVTALSILDLVPRPHGRVVGGEILFKGRDLRTLSREEMRSLRGDRISMIFQDPLTALNPVFTVGFQIAEVFRAHRDLPRRDAMERAVALLDLVGIPRARERAGDYPHQFSGGMRQRVMIAMAVALDPDLLIADEPTTALDVTIQAQILDVLLRVREEAGSTRASIILITHDLGVVAGVADRVMVMYAGRAAEVGPVDAIYRMPKHPYTWGLMTSITRLDRERRDRLVPIPGSPPSLIRVPPGCPFHPRCPHAQDVCRTDVPLLRPVGTAPGHVAACHFADQPGWEPPAELVAGGAR